jgi:hypothetical protein
MLKRKIEIEAKSGICPDSKYLTYCTKLKDNPGKIKTDPYAPQNSTDPRSLRRNQ